MTDAVSTLPAAEAEYVFACSPFVAESLARDPGLLDVAALEEAPAPADLDAAFLALAELTDEAAFMAALRHRRRRELCRIAWRDLTGRADPVAILRDLSAAADAAIRAAHAFARRATVARFGVPRDAAGVEQELVVIGMGKLGGRELNFSSDIDLIFLFPEAGETDRRGIDNIEFFTRMGQHLIRLLDAPTVDGFTYRVDMRLRPFGDSGPLASSFAMLEDYLQQHGRDWERYAWIKARAVTGAAAYAVLFRDVVRPFVFRRYLDFGVVESLREMKALIEREVQRRDRQEHVKLGPGGIREIEFIVQVFQLLRGGQEPALQVASLIDVLPALAHPKRLPPADVAALEVAYHFLRRVENRLQMVGDEQVHELPADDAGRERLARAMGLAGWTALAAELAQQRGLVQQHFAAVVAGTRPANGEAAAAAPVHTDTDALVAQWPPDEAARLAESLATLRGSGFLRRLEETGQRRLQALLPRLLQAVRGLEDGPAAFARMLRIVEAIGSRTAYLALLNENPLALQRLAEISAHGDFLPAQVAAFPLLLDELVDQRLFDEAPSRTQFAAELALKVPDLADDPERQVEVLRQFQRAAVFRVALWELTGRLPLMQVSDRLTDIAELILEEAMRLAWAQVTAVHGAPLCAPAGADGSPGPVREARIAAVGYGKLGGQELGYASDLDLVFLHDASGGPQQTAGPKVVDNAVFFLRLGQRILHLLTVHSAAGRLYEVDTRLRPSGKGGFLVTHIDAFHDYQRQEAWTWEHQALLHSRDVAGDAGLRGRFRAVREDVLCHHVRRDTLQDEVAKMRERMRHELSRAGEGQFDLKQDPGGVADIEFLAQYWVLRWAERYPPLAMFSDTIRQLESVGSAALVDHGDIDVLVDTYRRYRALNHRLALEGQPSVVEATPWAADRAAVQRIWAATFPAPV